jgi:hypothetical protein
MCLPHLRLFAPGAPIISFFNYILRGEITMFESEEEYNEMQAEIYGDDYAAPPDPDSLSEEQYNSMQEFLYGTVEPNPDADIDAYFGD